MVDSSKTFGRKTTHIYSHHELLALFEGSDHWDPIDEIVRIFNYLTPSTDTRLLYQTHETITRIFSGTYPGFIGGPTGYHDLRHTRNVALATIRLFHGLTFKGIHFPPGILLLGIACAYFHDTGMLLTDRDEEKNGAAYLKCHELRSLEFLQYYLTDKNFTKELVDGSTTIINCTNLMIDPRTLSYPSPEIQVAAAVVGTADILAQMADRYYLESLPLLYLEFNSAGVDRYQSELELMKQTARFYREVIEQRLFVAFDNTAAAARNHFREWCALDQNLYMDFIEKNIAYLEHALHVCGDDEECMGRFLRRKVPRILTGK